MVNDFLLQNIRRRQVIKVFEAVILQPENIEAGLLVCYQVFVAEVLEAFCLGPLVPVVGVIAGHEVFHVIQFQRPRLQREMLVGAQVVEPNALGVNLAVLGFGIKKQHIRFHALCVKNPRGQAQHRVHIAVFEKLAADFLARATFTEHIVRHHHGGFAIRLQHADDVLQEV